MPFPHRGIRGPRPEAAARRRPRPVALAGGEPWRDRPASSAGLATGLEWAGSVRPRARRGRYFIELGAIDILPQQEVGGGGDRPEVAPAKRAEDAIPGRGSRRRGPARQGCGGRGTGAERNAGAFDHGERVRSWPMPKLAAEQGERARRIREDTRRSEGQGWPRRPPPARKGTVQRPLVVEIARRP